MLDGIRWLREQRSRPEALANFDSSTTLVRALASALRGAEFPALGMVPKSVAPLVPLGNALPRRTRQTLYRRGSAREAIDPGDLGSVDVEAMRRWVTDRYPRRGYPAVVVGSASGAGVHLAALLGVPWLPQTFLVPVRRDVDPDEPRADFEWARSPGRALLEANPDLAIHHMNDPNQDRLPVPEVAYFRVKSLRLGAAYREFLRTVLAPGGTILLSDCTLEWPSTRVSDRHYFQFGCIGGLEPDEYYEGSDRVERFLAEQGSERCRWDPPAPDGERPEAEWGFQPPLADDVREFAASRDYRVRRLQFDHPRDLSPLVADLYRDRYDRRGFDADRLVAASFTQLDPWWTLRTGSVPFWLSFTAESDAAALESYLESVDDPYEGLSLTLFSHGVESAGLAGADRWRSVLERVPDGQFLGTDPEAFPFDYGNYVRYNTDFPRQITERRPLLDPVPLDRFERFVENRDTGSDVRLLEE